MNLEKNISIKMIEAGMKTKTELYRKCQLSQQTFDNILKRNDCKVSILIKIAEVLKCSVSDLIQ